MHSRRKDRLHRWHDWHSFPPVEMMRIDRASLGFINNWALVFPFVFLYRRFSVKSEGVIEWVKVWVGSSLDKDRALDLSSGALMIWASIMVVRTLFSRRCHMIIMYVSCPRNAMVKGNTPSEIGSGVYCPDRQQNEKTKWSDAHSLRAMMLWENIAIL